MLIKLCYTCVTCNVGFWCCHGRPRNLIPGNVERFSSRAHVHFCFNGKIGLVKWIVIEDAMLLGRSVGDVCATDAGPEIGKPPELGKLTTERKFLIKLAGFIRLMWLECWTGEKKKKHVFTSGLTRDVEPTAEWTCGSQTHSLSSVRPHKTMQWRGSQCWEVMNSSGVVERRSRRESMRMTRWVRIKALLERAGQINHCVLSCSRNPAVQEVTPRERKQTWDLCDKEAVNWVQVLLLEVESAFRSTTA